ncbi:radial spoke head 1 homolog [Dioscorea cayenensis subsp. rotundata]|uniref:Radial spoke head 1 homolog n=1 Tax=Dioscorea cayennensis subsp. rotundata TaxID=55577 RepID=A0AB40AX90_DIOCR|nr:radial spoke head 1 homolog [Dioscorea cayenensis subsp. rotundata]
MEFDVFRESMIFGGEMVGMHKMVWMSHGDEAARLPEGFEVVVRSVQGWWMRLRTHQRAGCMVLSTIRRYEGTIWDDLAHGKGVLVAEQGLVRYEGEWIQNQMEGHGVVEVGIPESQPIPGSK